MKIKATCWITSENVWQLTATTISKYDYTNDPHVYRYGEPQGALFPAYDEDGNLSELNVAGDLNCDGVVNNFDIDPFVLALTDTTQYAQQYPDCDRMQADLNGDGAVNSFDINYLTGAMGNVATGFEWDSENRLVRVAPLRSPQTGDVETRFAYDYLGRRVEKIVSEYRTTPSAGWYETEHRKFVWSGWLMLMELDGNDGNSVVRKYTWGLDLAGQSGQVNSLEGAGGIGGLLAVEQAEVGGGYTGGGVDAGDYVFAYDANGNVVQVLDWNAGSATAAIVAKYEYDPYGNVVASGGPYAEANPIRFSTKYWDDETGLGYWGYRYYSSRMGRWISRDPAGERGGPGLYEYVGNVPGFSVDAVGLCTRQVPRVHLPPVEKDLFDWINPVLFFGHYLLGSTNYLELSNAVGARIMSQSNVMGKIDELVRGRLSEGLGYKCGYERETGQVLRGAAYVGGAWTDVIGNFEYFGYARCWTQKQCDSTECAYRVSTTCELSFDAFDKYDFGPGGKAMDDPWAGRFEGALFNVYILHWSWDPQASGVWECNCNGVRVSGGASGSW